jgi:hypothetical protein
MGDSSSRTTVSTSTTVRNALRLPRRHLGAGSVSTLAVEHAEDYERTLQCEC